MNIIYDLTINDELSSLTLTFQKHEDYICVNEMLETIFSMDYKPIQSAYKYKVRDDAGSDTSKNPSEYIITVSNINWKEIKFLISRLNAGEFLTEEQDKYFQEACYEDRISVKPHF